MSKILDHIQVKLTKDDDDIQNRHVEMVFQMATKGSFKIPQDAILQGLEEQVERQTIAGIAKKMEAAIRDLVTEEEEKPVIELLNGRQR